MADVELVIRLSEKNCEYIKRFGASWIESEKGSSIVTKAILDGKLLPKHGDLFDKAEILRFLKCPKYENCDWKNCFDCNESRCINLNNVNDLVPIIEADIPESEDNE